jgi:hypothetical protein
MSIKFCGGTYCRSATIFEEQALNKRADRSRSGFRVKGFKGLRDFMES